MYKLYNIFVEETLSAGRLRNCGGRVDDNGDEDDYMIMMMMPIMIMMKMMMMVMMKMMMMMMSNFWTTPSFQWANGMIPGGTPVPPGGGRRARERAVKKTTVM